MPTPDTTRLGRPRPSHVIARDERIYQLITAGPRSRNSLADETGLPPSLVYLSLDRLRTTGRIRQCLRGSTIVWAMADGTPCP